MANVSRKKWFTKLADYEALVNAALLQVEEDYVAHNVIKNFSASLHLMRHNQFIVMQKSAIAGVFEEERDSVKIETYTQEMFKNLQEKCLSVINYAEMNAYFWLHLEHKQKNRTRKEYCDDLYCGVMRDLWSTADDHQSLLMAC